MEVSLATDTFLKISCNTRVKGNVANFILFVKLPQMNISCFTMCKGWSQNWVKIFYLYTVKIEPFTPSPFIFTDNFHPPQSPRI